jgi:hypothetical protein
MVKLSKPQITVLRKLDRDGVCPTTTSTTGMYVAGTVAAALVRRKLAKHVARRWGNVVIGFDVGITNEGRQALRALDFKINGEGQA